MRVLVRSRKRNLHRRIYSTSTTPWRNKVYKDNNNLINTAILLVVTIAEVDSHMLNKTIPQQAYVNCTSTTKPDWTPYGSGSTLSVANHRSGV